MSKSLSEKQHFIVIDQGNTLTKVVLFYGNEIQWFKVYKDFTPTEINILVPELVNVKYGIISSVSFDPEKVIDYFENIQWIILDHETPIPITNNYNTPQTLGKDRLAGVIAASDLFPGKDTLVIDAGTAITCDFITKDKVYVGGSISPGITMRFKALNTFTGRLPLVEINESDITVNGNSTSEQLIAGRDTRESILSGVINGAIFEISGFINKYKEIYPDLNVVVTGGDAIYFDKNLKSNIFVVQNLVPYGLKLILQYKLEK